MGERGTKGGVARERSVASVRGYHAHVYYDEHTREAARTLREAVATGFEVRVGRWHDEPVGPHPRASYQIAFAAGRFGALVSYLAFNRAGLTVFVHPETGDDLADHVEYALWMGELLPLNLAALR